MAILCFIHKRQHCSRYASIPIIEVSLRAFRSAADFNKQRFSRNTSTYYNSNLSTKGYVVTYLFAFTFAVCDKLRFHLERKWCTVAAGSINTSLHLFGGKWVQMSDVFHVINVIFCDTEEAILHRFTLQHTYIFLPSVAQYFFFANVSCERSNVARYI